MKELLLAYRHYEQINPIKIERPGLSRSIKIGYEEISMMTAAELSKMSNAEIAQYLNDFEEKKALGRFHKRIGKSTSGMCSSESTTIYG